MPDPKPSQREEVARFRLGIVGDLLTRDLEHGELQAELQQRAARRYRPPGANATRTYHWKTLQKWLRAARRGAGKLQPASRSRGIGLALDEVQRETLLAIRRAHPSAAAELILSEAVRNGVVAEGQISVSTLRRLFRQHDLSRSSMNRASRRALRRKWAAARVGPVWHADVCHVAVRTPAGTRRVYRVHALLDDHSRFLVALEVRETETERDLLAVLCTALMQNPAPEVFFVDNGSCYIGNVLATTAQRLEIRLVHAQPYDPEARGKMERLWRTMRQQCADHLGPVESASRLQVALLAWADAYNRRPHGGLMGDRPVAVYREGIRALPAPRTAAQLARALETTTKRRVRKDATLSVDGMVYEVAGWLAGKTLDVRVCGLTGAVLGACFQERDVPIGHCDAVANRHRARPAPTDAPPRADLPFHPVAGWLAAARQENPDV